MPILLHCTCGKKLRVPDEMVGKRVRCPACSNVLPVVAAETAVAPAAEPANTGITWEELGLPKPKPGSREAMASNPGRVRVHYGHYFRCFPIYPLVLACLALVFIPAALLWHWGFWAGFLAFLPLNYLYWSGVRWQGLYGDVNPAVVLPTDSYLVAVYTNLSAQPGEYWPAIKVVRQPLLRMTGGPPTPDTPLATVATYFGSGKASHWDDFFPEVVNCLTTDAGVVARVQATILDDEWEQLEAGLKQVPTPYKPGLYKLSPEGDEEEEEESRQAIPRERLETLIGRHLPHQCVPGWYLAGQIPAKKLQNALDTYAREVQPDQVLGLGDGSAFGSAKDGVLLTTQGFVFNNSKVAGKVRWQDIVDATVVGGWPSYEMELRCGRGKVLKVDFAGFDGKFPDGLARLFRRIGELNQGP
jgi:hypothetical protein